MMKTARYRHRIVQHINAHSRTTIFRARDFEKFISKAHQCFGENFNITEKKQQSMCDEKANDNVDNSLYTIFC